MADSRRGKKQNYTKNYVSRNQWMENKRKDRPTQVWVWEDEANNIGSWQVFVDGIGILPRQELYRGRTAAN